VRIRQIKPSFWSDEKLATLPDPTRLFYIGLWQMADDGGWLRWNVREVGATLYPYRAATARERQVERHAAELGALQRLAVLDCGHAYIPNLTKHQHLPGPAGRVLGISKEHDSCVARDATPAHADSRDSTLRKGKGKGNGKGKEKVEVATLSHETFHPTDEQRRKAWKLVHSGTVPENVAKDLRERYHLDTFVEALQ
jgi:hypothetical protein